MANKFREEDHPRAKDGKFTKKGSGESSNPKDLQRDVPDSGASEQVSESDNPRQLQKDIHNSGGVSGALNYDDPRAKEHAERYYEEIRHREDDIDEIANNTGYKKEEIVEIKKYLFYDIHNLDGEKKRFDPDFYMAQSWQRMAEGKNILDCDLMLLKHEIYEMEIKKQNPNLTHDEAHDLANEKYNYKNAYKEAIKNGQIKED